MSVGSRRFFLFTNEIEATSTSVFPNHHGGVVMANCLVGTRTNVHGPKGAKTKRNDLVSSSKQAPENSFILHQRTFDNYDTPFHDRNYLSFSRGNYLNRHFFVLAVDSLGEAKS